MSTMKISNARQIFDSAMPRLGFQQQSVILQNQPNIVNRSSTPIKKVIRNNPQASRMISSTINPISRKREHRSLSLPKRFHSVSIGPKMQNPTGRAFITKNPIQIQNQNPQKIIRDPKQVISSTIEPVSRRREIRSSSLPRRLTSVSVGPQINVKPNFPLPPPPTQIIAQNNNNNEVKKFQVLHNQKLSENQNLMMKVESLQRDNLNFLEENESLKKTIFQLEEQLYIFQEQIQNQNNIIPEDQSEEFRAEIEKRDTQIENLSKAYQELLAKFHSSEGEKNELLRKLVETNKHLVNQNDYIELKDQSNIIEKLKNEIINQRKQLNEKEKKISKIKLKCEIDVNAIKCTKEAKIVELNNRIVELEQKLYFDDNEDTRDLKDDLDFLKNVNFKSHEITLQNYNTTVKKLENLSKEFEEFKAKHKNIEILIERGQFLDQRIKELETEKKEIGQSNSVLNNDFQSLKQKINELNFELENAKKINEKLINENEENEEIIVSLEKKLKEVAFENEELTQEIQNNAMDQGKIRNENQEIFQKNRDFYHRNLELEEQLKEQNEKILYYENQINELIELNQAKDDEIVRALAQNNKLSVQLSKLAGINLYSNTSGFASKIKKENPIDKSYPHNLISPEFLNKIKEHQNNPTDFEIREIRETGGENFKEEEEPNIEISLRNKENEYEKLRRNLERLKLENQNLREEEQSESRNGGYNQEFEETYNEKTEETCYFNEDFYAEARAREESNRGLGKIFSSKEKMNLDSDEKSREFNIHYSDNEEEKIKFNYKDQEISPKFTQRKDIKQCYDSFGFKGNHKKKESYVKMNEYSKEDLENNTLESPKISIKLKNMNTHLQEENEILKKRLDNQTKAIEMRDNTLQNQNQRLSQLEDIVSSLGHRNKIKINKR